MAYDVELADRLRDLVEAVAEGRDVTEKKMFGGLGFMVDGHMAVAASSYGGLLLRCPPEQTEALIASAPGSTGRFEMRGRAMDGWLRVDPEAAATEDDLRRWVEVGVDYVGTLPPKE
jgi:TfoX/Sxy family transcriptional regulator of competence genes